MLSIGIPHALLSDCGCNVTRSCMLLLPHAPAATLSCYDGLEPKTMVQNEPFLL